MPKYDRQLIIMFHCGNSNDVKVVKDGARLLNEKGQQHEANNKKSHLITAPVGNEWHKTHVLATELKKLTDQSRLYIYGHCDWGVQKVGTYTGKEMADLLYLRGLPKVQLISFVACKTARDYDPDPNKPGLNLECFAAQFLKGLAAHGRETEVYARSDTTGVFPEKAGEVMLGRKWTRPDDKQDDDSFMYNQAPRTKWKFTYENAEIRMERVRYKNDLDPPLKVGEEI